MRDRLPLIISNLQFFTVFGKRHFTIWQEAFTGFGGFWLKTKMIVATRFLGVGCPSVFSGFFYSNVCSFLNIMKVTFLSRGHICSCYLKIQNRISGGDLMIPVFERFTCFPNNTFG